MRQAWKRILWRNFLMGLARGIGIAFGATIVAALILYGLSKLVSLPLIGKYIAEIVEIVEMYLAQR